MSDELHGSVCRDVMVASRECAGKVWGRTTRPEGEGMATCGGRRQRVCAGQEQRRQGEDVQLEKLEMQYFVQADARQTQPICSRPVILVRLGREYHFAGWSGKTILRHYL